MNKLLIIIILFCYSPLQVQFNAKDYYDEINKIELLIINEEFDKAIRKYKKLEKKYELFERDLWNAWLCSYYCKSDKQFSYFLDKIVTRNVSLDEFENNNNIAHILESNIWKKHLPLFGKIKRKSNDKYSKLLAQRLEALFLADQNPRTDTSFPYDSLYYKDSINFEELKKIHLEFDYPNRNYRGKSTINSCFKGEVVLLHYPSWNCDFCMDMKTFYKKIINEGKIDVRDLTFILTRCGCEEDNFGVALVKIENEYYLPLFEEDKKKNINSFREEWYHCSLGERKKKITYRLEHPEFYISSSYHIGFSDIEMQERVRKDKDKFERIR